MAVGIENFLLMDKFKKERLYLLYGNFYPSKRPNPKFIIIGLLTLAYSWTELLSMIAVIFVEKDNLTKISETLLFCMTQVAFLCKLTNFIMKHEQMLKIEHLLKHPILNDLSEAENEILEEYLIPFRHFSNIYRILCILCVVFYGMFPFIDEDPEHLLPLPGWFPFDVKTYQYEILFAQVIGIGIGAFNNSNTDILTTVLITMATAQFDILKSRLTNICKTRNKTSNVKESLNNCIHYHNLLLEFVLEIEELFNNGIFVQFFASVVVICLTGFQMLVISFKSTQFVLLIVYFSTMTCQIVLYCWYGNELMFSSQGISEACYMSDWNNFDKSECKTLYIIMEKGKRPVQLTAGKLFTLSLTTLMAILRSSYSYFAVLQRLYSTNE